MMTIQTVEMERTIEALNSLPESLGFEVPLNPIISLQFPTEIEVKNHVLAYNPCRGVSLSEGVKPPKLSTAKFGAFAEISWVPEEESFTAKFIMEETLKYCYPNAVQIGDTTRYPKYSKKLNMIKVEHNTRGKVPGTDVIIGFATDFQNFSEINTSLTNKDVEEIATYYDDYIPTEIASNIEELDIVISSLK